VVLLVASITGILTVVMAARTRKPAMDAASARLQVKHDRMSNAAIGASVVIDDDT
jgi:hypothetical protein